MRQVLVRCSARVFRAVQSSGAQHTVKETAQHACNDIVEVKNPSGRLQLYSPGIGCAVLGVWSVCVCVEAGDGVCSGFKEQPSERILSRRSEWEGLKCSCHGNPSPILLLSLLPSLLVSPLPPRFLCWAHR